MKNTKVMVIGFQKTGTTTLDNALKRLGYKVKGWDTKLAEIEEEEEALRYIIRILKRYDAVQDMPWPLYYKKLYELYPNAKFILTFRDPDSWIRSVVRYFGSRRIPIQKKIYNTPCAEGYESKYLEIYNKFNKEVIEFFQGKDNFLIMKTGIDFNYEKLCNFLDIHDIPTDAFPSSNKSRKLSKYKLYRDIHSLYINFKKGYLFN